MKKLPILIAVVAVVVFVLINSIFIVDERQQALKLQFGQVVGKTEGYREPGLYFKIPLIQNVVYYEDRILPLEGGELEVTPIDDRRLVVDAFARWRITDPVRFRQAVTNELNALPRLERVLNASLREVLGSVTSDTILSDERSELMTRIRDTTRAQSLNLGVQIVDVRLRRVDLPQQNLQATFQRMQAEREREAADERARGEEAAQRIRANADRQAIELVSEARRESEVIRGQADGERNRIFAAAYGKDEEFFAFYRSLRAYETALKGNNSSIVLTPDSEFFRYFTEGELTEALQEAADARAAGSEAATEAGSDAAPAQSGSAAAPAPAAPSATGGSQAPAAD
ncbi:protease modulator HflC [Albimonas sp. CAU 1670]|uniref:protease modulator HflC n=1 Tax=Albimonas sp. CAU 1670 TaxID=3032599 RepID=UPI0023DC78BA|nr:protease modulator HflC [Albimonas sp. CAU 1670]MDF2232930.1 protease modulator HflC [Albimonas sp. CAU 1670]